jgi:hypothetical protein
MLNQRAGPNLLRMQVRVLNPSTFADGGCVELLVGGDQGHGVRTGRDSSDIHHGPVSIKQMKIYSENESCLIEGDERRSRFC